MRLLGPPVPLLFPLLIVPLLQAPPIWGPHYFTTSSSSHNPTHSGFAVKKYFARGCSVHVFPYRLHAPRIWGVEGGGVIKVLGTPRFTQPPSWRSSLLVQGRGVQNKSKQSATRNREKCPNFEARPVSVRSRLKVGKKFSVARGVSDAMQNRMGAGGRPLDPVGGGWEAGGNGAPLIERHLGAGGHR